MVLSNEEGYNLGEIFWLSFDRSYGNYDVCLMRMYYFFGGINFVLWFCKYVD